MNNNTFSRWKESLHLKILSGYLILGLLVLGIITAVWYEKQVFEQAEAEERSLLMQRAAASEAYRGLITLFLDNDRAMLWDDSDMDTYDRRESHTMEVIDRLKGYYGEPAQSARIDTVVRLLHEKRRLIGRMVDMPTTAFRMDSLLERHLPGLEQTASVRTTTVTERTEPEEEKKRGGLFGLFRKKKKEEPARTTTRVSTTPNTRHIAEMRRFEEEMRTALAEQEQAFSHLSDSLKIRNSILNRNLSRLIREIGQDETERMFEEEMRTALAEQEQAFSHLSDSLKIRNSILNRNLSRLIREIGQDETERMEERHMRVAELRETAFVLICGISAAGVLCAVLLYVVVHRDIRRRTRDRKQREELIESLRRSVRENEELIKSRQNIMQTVTHDLRSPLTAIRGNAELILKDGNREATALHAEHIRQSAERMGALMENLLDYYRIDNGKETVRVKPFRLAGVAETLETEFAARMEEKRLEFRVNNAADEVVMGDRNLILRIGSKLLSNALKFTERGGVTLTALYAGGKFTLAVEDTGGGIDKDKREQIFKPFERLSNAATQDGFGLGLSIVKSLAELMEGSISVENIRNTGSRFSVVLPLPQAEKAGETDRKAAARRTRLGGCSVLSLDNDSIILGMIHDIFVQNGVHCDTCTSTGEMAEKLREGHYDLLTTDLKMQDASGYEVLELLRTSDIGNSRTIPVMVVTDSKSITKEELADAGFGSVLYKPFSIDELLAAAEECIGEDSTPRIDLGPLFAYGDKRQRLECLVRETEKEMAAIREEAERCDRDRLDYWIHHIRSSWMLIHAEGPLQELYDVLHGNGTAEEIREYAGKVTGQGETIIRLARKEMERTVWEE